MADTSVATPNTTHNPWPHTPVFTDTVTLCVVFFFFGDLLDVAEKGIISTLVDPLVHFCLLQGTKKVIFTAYHSGKLYLAFTCTSPKVISTCPKRIFDS